MTDDERIHKAIKARLEQRSEIDASSIEIKVDGGEVRLRGAVEDRPAKDIALKEACKVVGVVEVKDELTVKPEIGDEASALTTEFGDKDAADAETGPRFLNREAL